MAQVAGVRPGLNMLAAREAVDRALAEDMGTGDLTTSLTVPAGTRATARLELREPAVLAGMAVAELAFRRLDPELRWESSWADGDAPSDLPRVIARLDGLAAAILSAERTALNFLQRMTGIATATRRLVELAAGRVTVIDTRKTVPGLRALDKYSVGVGGGRNHRFGLFDGVLIKENHIRAAGGIGPAVSRCRQGVPLLTRIEVEVTDLDELRQALEAGADVILLDNMSVEQMREAAAITAGRAQLEASGGVTAETLPGVAASGVEFVSSGALTHSVRAVDISLLVER
ncbi:MAG: carboxylating nicotinate-nucleotide diphosphorylase [Chloroflexota bacterium]